MPTDTLGRWLDRAGEARFLVTTREVLGLPGEEALALAPLGLSDAAALFMRRAASARRDFQPGAEDQAAIPQLVKLLDGLPLAIELAAARVRVMPPGRCWRAWTSASSCWWPRWPAGSPGHAARRLRLVMGAAVRGRKGGAGPVVGVRRRLHARSGRSRARPVAVRRRALGRGLAALAGRQVLRAAAGRRALRPAGQRAGVRRRPSVRAWALSRAAATRRAAKHMRAMASASPASRTSG